MESVLVWLWRKEKIKVEINPLLFFLSPYREESRILGRLGHAILFHHSYKNAINLYIARSWGLFVIIVEYWEQASFGDNVASIITLEIARSIEVGTRTFHHIGDGYNLTCKQTQFFEVIARIVDFAIQVVFDKPRFDLAEWDTVDWTDWHHLLSTIEANENLDTLLFFAVFAFERIVNGIDIVEWWEFDYIAFGKCKGSVGFARLSKFFVANTLHTSKLCIWFWKINVYHNKIN